MQATRLPIFCQPVAHLLLIYLVQRFSTMVIVYRDGLRSKTELIIRKGLPKFQNSKAFYFTISVNAVTFIHYTGTEDR